MMKKIINLLIYSSLIPVLGCAHKEINMAPEVVTPKGYQINQFADIKPGARNFLSKYRQNQMNVTSYVGEKVLTTQGSVIYLVFHKYEVQDGFYFSSGLAANLAHNWASQTVNYLNQLEDTDCSMDKAPEYADAYIHCDGSVPTIGTGIMIKSAKFINATNSYWLVEITALSLKSEADSTEKAVVKILQNLR